MKYTYLQYFGTTMEQMVDGKKVFIGTTINGHVEIYEPPATCNRLRSPGRDAVLVPGVRLRGGWTVTPGE